MAITRLNPNTVFLGGDRTQIGDLAVSETVTPGHLLDRFNAAGVIRWRKHTSAGLAVAPAVATEHSMANRGVDDNYLVGELAEVSILHKGAAAWMFIASGQNIVAGNKLESAGDGTLKIYATAGGALFSALENKPTVTALTRIRVEAL